MDEISDLDHENLIKRIAAITRGRQKLLLFLWADGGNLRDFWKELPEPQLTPTLVKDIIYQLRGMAEALDKLHHFKHQYHYRHGDIKPENILHFPDSTKRSPIGIFKISDLGSAKHHSVATKFRERTGGKAFATMEYQPPEAKTNELSKESGPTSRLYDIWSMGCVTLEFMLWLLYGYKELEQFKEEIKDINFGASFFILKTVDVVEETGVISTLVAGIHPAVEAYINRLSEDPECRGNTALGDLLDIVKTKLLVIDLAQKTPSMNELPNNISIISPDGNSKSSQRFGNFRTSAKGFVNALDDILESKYAKSESYWFTGQSRDNITIPRIKSSIISGEKPRGKSSFLSPSSALDISERGMAARLLVQNQDVGVPYSHYI